MADYVVIEATTLADDRRFGDGLTSKVNRFLGMGYIPVGGLVTYHYSKFYQAMMKPVPAPVVAAAMGGRRSLRRTYRRS